MDITNLKFSGLSTEEDLTEDLKDEIPPSNYEYACEVCGKEIFYGGRGRKPKYCDEHKTNKSSKSSTGKTKISGQGAQLAAQATEALVQLNGLFSMGLTLVKLPMTAGALNDAQEGFRESTYNALLTDPELCKTILRVGTTSGKVALMISYSMLIAAVAPVGVLEYKLVQKAKEDKELEVNDEDRPNFTEPVTASQNGLATG